MGGVEVDRGIQPHTTRTDGSAGRLKLNLIFLIFQSPSLKKKDFASHDGVDDDGEEGRS